jgi:hypothetical protein
MAMKRLSISALLAGALIGLPLTAARADKPTTAEEAEAAAKAANDRADHYRELGGVGYKAGLVQSSEAEAARYEAMAQTLAPAPTAAEPQTEAPAPFAYKTASAEQDAVMKPHAKEAQDKAQLESQGSGQTPNPTCENTKPVTDFLCKHHFD